MAAPSVFLYVQHLLGVGHLKRAATLARGMAGEGFRVTVATGGLPVAGMDFGPARVVQLPPVAAADLGFRRLVDDRGREVDDAWRIRRVESLLAAWHESAADVLVVELFPFGRRQMRFELLPLLEAAAARKPKPLVACSVRDLLGGRATPDRVAEAIAWSDRFVDRVLVHSDPAVVPFDRTFPRAGDLGEKLAYTGYVVDTVASGNPDQGDEVLVSAGGGAVGVPLLTAAIRARALSVARARPWRVLGGENITPAALDDLRRLAGREGGGRIVVERSRPDFTALLARCALSISQAGYNTLMETVCARARAVVVPFSGGHETEQALRAGLFAARGLLHVVEEAVLGPETLATAIDEAMARPRPGGLAVDVDGARHSARLLRQWLGASE